MKENDKVLISKLLLKATFVLLVISVFLKLCGLNVFGADTGNTVLISISNFIDKFHLKIILDLILLIISYYIFFSLTTINKNQKLIFIVSIIISFLTTAVQNIIFKYLPYKYNQNALYFIFTLIILLITPQLINLFQKEKGKKTIVTIFTTAKKSIFYILLIMFYQLIVMFLRNVTINSSNEILYDILLNFDYTILLLITYYLYIKKDAHIELNSWFDFNLTSILNNRLSFDEIKLGLVKLKDFKKEYNQSNKEDKITIILYIIFSTLSELINFSLVIFIAYLNNALIECFFIITSFLISRKVFGAFHLKSAIQCWMLSNVSFYLLSKLTINIGITYVIPVLCGIALSYITSKFIKKTNKSLYKGIPEKDLLDIVQNKKLTDLELEILKKYYCSGISMDRMTFIYHYSRAQLYRYKANAEKKLIINIK